MTTTRHLTRPTAHGTSDDLYDWRQQAACLGDDPAIFEPDDRRTPPPQDWDLPRSICADCPVREACLDDAIAPDRRADFGMRGGRTPDERRQIIKHRDQRARDGRSS